jgi:hypothetical protein
MRRRHLVTERNKLLAMHARWQDRMQTAYTTLRSLEEAVKKIGRKKYVSTEQAKALRQLRVAETTIAGLDTLLRANRDEIRRIDDFARAKAEARKNLGSLDNLRSRSLIYKNS